MDFKNFVKFSNLTYNEYQDKGVQWCLEREKSSEYCRGGIVADEMGLGKTIMMIGTMVANFKMHSLIILPVFLVEQWSKEIFKTTGHRVLVYQGKIKKTLTKEMLSKSPIILTTYGNILTDSKKNNILNQISWSRVICDEAHHMRSRKSKIKKAVINLKTEIMWLISGTPIQNRINDLYSLFEVLKIPKAVFIQTNNLKDIMTKIVLKRTKKEVGLKLPDLNMKRITTQWKNQSEKKLSEEIHDKLSFSLLKHSFIPLDKEMLLSMMTFARMVCIYPEMMRKHTTKLKCLGFSNDSISGINFNSKMDKVIDTIVSRKNNGSRKIIFTNFKGEIDYLVEKLTAHGIKTDFIDGRITKRKRTTILDTNLDVLILQIKTGNEGLNLQEYNEVYFVTPNWNPKVEDQAVARCHRLGQKKEVSVFRFVMNSFDNELKTKNIEMHTESIQTNKIEVETNVWSEN